MTDGTHETLTTGRPLQDGTPVAGPRLELDPDGPSVALLASTDRPLASNPGAGTWGVLVEEPTAGDRDRPVLAQWLAPDASEPPPHIHPTTETFEVLEGTLTVVLDGSPRRLTAGESLTVEAGVEHSFRNDTGGTVGFRAAVPSMRTVRALYTVWGRDHEQAQGNGDYGEPGALEALVLGADLYDETTMAVAPVPVQRLLWATVGRAARVLGHEGIDGRYLDDAFWERHVEQPTHDDAA